MKIKSAKDSSDGIGYDVELQAQWFDKLFGGKSETIKFIPDGRRMFGGYTVYINCKTGEREDYHELDSFICRQKYSK